jgi:hypothetical protein
VIGEIPAVAADGGSLLDGHMSELVMCTTHGVTPHPESVDCLWPHLVAPEGSLPSMTAAETLDPREAI